VRYSLLLLPFLYSTGGGFLTLVLVSRHVFLGLAQLEQGDYEGSEKVPLFSICIWEGN